jgi:hypothetical protein
MLVQYTFSAPVWVYPGKGGWHSITIPQNISDALEARLQGTRRGWGSVPAHLTIGATRWQTSLFPDKALSASVVPLKAEVRTKERIRGGDAVSVLLELNL